MVKTALSVNDICSATRRTGVPPRQPLLSLAGQFLLLGGAFLRKVELADVTGGFLVKASQTSFAAELDLAILVDVNKWLSHGTKLLIGNQAGGERICFDSFLLSFFQFANVFGRLLVEILQAAFAAKFDLAIFVDVNIRRAH
jgi:hypothetical protein